MSWFRYGVIAVAAWLAGPGAASAQDQLKIAIGQRGGWEQCVSDLGQNAGIFRKHGLVLETLYTQGSGETLQIVIGGSVDVGIGTGTHAILGAFAKGAPIRLIGSSFTSANDQLYYVRGDSPLRSMADANGKTIGISTTGSSSHILSLALAKQFGITLVPTPTGNYTATLTQVMTKQVDLGFSQAPFGLDSVENGRIRILATGGEIAPVRNQTLRTMITGAAVLEKRRDVLARYLRGYQETLDWLYSSPDAIKAYAAWSSLEERLARRAPEFIKREHLDPARFSGIESVMADAVTFKYLPVPLSHEQLTTLVQISAAPR